jgi:hypothetical protein
MTILFNHLPKTGGLFLGEIFFKNFESCLICGQGISEIQGKKHKEIKYDISEEDYKLNHEIIYYHHWEPWKYNLNQFVADNNLKFDTSFTLIRNPIEMFYSGFFWIKTLCDTNQISETGFINSYFYQLMVLSDAKNPHMLIDYMEKNNIKFDEVFPNYIYRHNDFELIEKIYLYSDVFNNLNCFFEDLNIDFKNFYFIDYKEFKTKYDSYGKSKSINKNYKIDYIKNVLKISFNVYENLIKTKVKFFK